MNMLKNKYYKDNELHRLIYSTLFFHYYPLLEKLYAEKGSICSYKDEFIKSVYQCMLDVLTVLFVRANENSVNLFFPNLIYNNVGMEADFDIKVSSIKLWIGIDSGNLLILDGYSKYHVIENLEVDMRSGSSMEKVFKLLVKYLDLGSKQQSLLDILKKQTMWRLK